MVSDFASSTTADISSSPRQLTIGALSNGTSYYFRVLARNTVGSGSYSTSSGAVTPASSPSIPSNLQATESDETLILSWNAPSDGGSPIIDYTVQYSTTSVFSIYQSVVGAGGAASTTLTGLANGTTYFFKVKARNALGTGANSSASAEYIPRASRTISIDALSYLATYVMTATPPTISATASAGVGVKSFLTSNTSVCTINSSSGVVTFVSAGTCSIAASIAQFGAYLAADSSSISFAIELGTQSVSWSPATAITTSQSPLTPSVAATSSGDGAISYSVTAAGTTGCAVNLSSGVLTYSAAGSCVVRATAAATSAYSTRSLDVTFTVSLVTQTVTWSPTTALTTIQSPTTPLAASSSGNGAISYAVTLAGTTGCAINSSTRVLTFSAAGSCVVRATAAATSAYSTSSIDATFVITLAAPGTPLQPTGVAGSGKVTVTVAAGTGGTPSSYTVTASPQVGGVTKTCTVAGPSGNCIVTGLLDNTAYTFTATATNATGTSAASSASASVTPLTTCANGGVCAVGDTGPGGGVVFYVAASNFTSTGSTCNTACKYLEAAPTSGTASWTDAGYVWSGNTSQSIGVNAQATAIGAGFKNTQAMVAQNNTANRAGTITRAYRGPNNFTDWYLPSRDELSQLYVQRLVVGAITTINSFYWSSTELSNGNPSPLNFNNNTTDTTNPKSEGAYVRPVRAF